jgi:hypothetical protein
MNQERAVGLEHEESNCLGQPSREATRVEDFATCDEEAHSRRTVPSVSDMAIECDLT